MQMEEEKDSLEKYLSNPLEYRPNFQKEERERVAWELKQSELDETLVPAHKDPDGPGEGLVTQVIGSFLDSKERLKEKIRLMERELHSTEVAVSHIDKPYIEKAKSELGLSSGPLTILDYKKALNDYSNAGTYLVDYIEKWSEGINGDLNWELYPDLIEVEQELSLIESYIGKLIYPLIEFNYDGEDRLEKLKQKEKEWGETYNKANNTHYLQKESYKEALLFNPELILAHRGKLHEIEKIYDEKRFEFSQIENSLIVVNEKTNNSEYVMNHIDYLLGNEEDLNVVSDDFTKLADDNLEEKANYEHMQTLLHLTLDLENEDKGKLKNTLRTVYSLPTQNKLLDELSGQQDVYRKDTLPLLHYMRGYQGNVKEESSGLFSKLTRGMSANDKKRQDNMHQFFTTSQATSSLRRRKLSQVEEKELSRKGYHHAIKKQEEAQQ